MTLDAATLAALGAAELRARLVAGECSVRDLAEALLARIDDADTAKTLRRHLDQRVGHLGAERLKRYRVARMHEVAGIFQHRAELAARMQHAEIDGRARYPLSRQISKIGRSGCIGCRLCIGRSFEDVVVAQAI